MRLADYDQAMLARWRYYFPNTYLVNSEGGSDREVRNQIIAESGGNLEEESIYPYLTLRRIGVPIAQPMNNNHSMVQRGIRIKEEEQTLAMTQFKCTYQLDLYSSDREIFDEMAVELQENLLREGYLNIDTGDRLLGNQSVTIDLEDVEDTTDVESRQDMAPIYRCTFLYSVMYTVPRRFRHLRVEEFILNFKVKGELPDEVTDYV